MPGRNHLPLATDPGWPTLQREMAGFLAAHYTDAAWSRAEHYRWISGLLLAVASKTGHLFILDRETGRPLIPVQERPVPKSDVAGGSHRHRPAGRGLHARRQ